MITHRIKNLTILALFVLLLISGIGNILQNKSRKNKELTELLNNALNQVEIEKHRARAEFYADRAREVDSLRVLERDLAKVAESALKIENQGYRKTISRLRPLITTHIDSIPDLRDFVASQDSLINGQDSLIMSLEFSCMAQVRSFEEVIRLNRAQIQEQVAVSNTLQEMVVSEQGKTRKEVRKKKFFRTLSLIGAGGIAFLLLKPN